MIQKLLEQGNIRQAKKLVSEYKFFLEGIPVEIGIKVYQNITDFDGYSFTQSHYLKTPSQAMAYRTHGTHSGSEEDCLRLALNTFLTEYNIALRNDHAPSDDWLEPNNLY
jgi:hypothetical protein